MSRNAHWYTWPLMLAIACGGDGGKKGGTSDGQDAGDNSALDGGGQDENTEPDPPSDAGAKADTGTEADTGTDADASVTSCPDGFELSEGACVAAPCSELDCGAHGTCVEVEGAAQCSCSVGFAGELCDACAEGYEGDACDSCADGFVQDEQGCVADLCIGVTCGAHGACVVEQGSPTCACHEGWAGDKCNTCALGWASRQGQCVLEPQTLVNMRIWQDASASSTLRFDAEGRVTEWRSRITGEEELAFEAGAESSRPGVVTGEGQRRRIRFDGDDALTRTLMLTNNAYTMYIVARWDAEATTQWVLGGTNAAGNMHGIQLYTNASGLVYRHRFPFAITGGESVSSNDYTPAEGLQLIVIQRSNAGDGYLRQYFGADFVETTPLVSSAISEALRLTLGQSGLTTPTDSLKGEIAEILVYGGAHAQSTRDQITTYLRVKWGLLVPGQQL